MSSITIPYRFIAALLGSLLSLGGVGWAAPERPAKTWKTCEEMSEAEKNELQMDCRWSHDVPRDPNVSYAPLEDFPFQPPYTADEILYLADIIMPLPRRDTDLIVNGQTINTRASLYENQGSVAIHVTTNFDTYWDRIKKLKGGDPIFYVAPKYNLPPSNYGFGFVEVEYKIVPGEGMKTADRWLYLPSLRKVRRVPSPRRDDVVPQYDFVFDDSIGRPPWEYDSRIIGVDTVYPEQFYRFTPQDRPWLKPYPWDAPNTWTVVKLNLRNVPVLGVPDPSPLGLEPYTYPDIGPDGGVQCYVIEGKPKPDFLPGYYASRRMVWITVKEKLFLREELYDNKEGDLFFINEHRPLNYRPQDGRMGIARWHSHYWDIRIDHMSNAPYVFFTNSNRNYKDPHLYDPQKLLKIDEFLHPLNSFDFTLKNPQLFPMRPQLWPEKFPEQRGKRVTAYLTAEIQERIKRQDAANRLVFDGE